MLYLLGLVATLGALVYCALDVLRTPSRQVRTLPKPLWLALVVVFPLLTALPWLLFGRPQPGVVSAGAGSAAASTPMRVVHPDDDEDFLRSLRERTEEQRRRAREQEPPPAG